MNRWDALSAWLYHRKDTSFQRVKTACRSLSFAEGFGEDWSPLGHASYWTRPLFELGYVEYDEGGRVIVCSPGIVLTADHSRGILSGFWSQQYLAKLRRCNVRRFRKQNERGPTSWSIVGDKQAIQGVATECDVWLASDPGDQILKHLPSVDRWIESLAGDNSSPAGVWERMSFRDHRPNWVS